MDLEQYRGKAYVCIGAKKDDQNNLTKYACVLTADAPHKFRLWDTETGTTTILDAFRALEGTNTSLVSTREDGVSQKARDAVPKAFSVLQRNQRYFLHTSLIAVANFLIQLQSQEFFVRIRYTFTRYSMSRQSLPTWEPRILT